jgi:hypothetical protein
VPWTLGQIVDRSVFEGIDEAQAIQIANQVYAGMIRRSGFFKGQVVLGAVDPVTGSVPLPAQVAKILSIWVQDTSSGETVNTQYPNRVSPDEFMAYANGSQSADKRSFTESFPPDGAAYLMLWPAPDAGVVVASVEFNAIPLVNLADPVMIPDEFIQGLLDGIKGVVYKDIDEDVQSAQIMEQSCAQATAELEDYTRARTVGDGPIVIPQRGVHW